MLDLGSAPPLCAACSDKGWSVYNERRAEGYFGEVQRCDCGKLAVEEDAWEAARAAGMILDDNGQVLLDARSPVRFGLKLVERGPYGYTFEGKRGGRTVLRRWTQGEPKMYVTNGHGNITSVKGNYTWCDNHGVLRPLHPAEHPDAILRRAKA